MGDKVRAIGTGGIGLVHRLAEQSGLVDAIDRSLHLLKVHRPYHESDHVLNIAYNAICGGLYLQDIELLRNDETYLDALGAESIPDPTTAGDFCRRFDSPHKIARLQDAIDEARLNVWKRQEDSFFEQAVIDMDGHVLETTGSCKQGMDISYNGKWGYHPLLVSLANTQEVLAILNRPGNWTSQQRSLGMFDKSPYLFYITNDRESSASEIVFSCNDRCQQENLIEQLKNGVRALRAPVDNLLSNWAYMVMTSLAWTLKAWSALWLPVDGRWREQHEAERESLLRMEFKTFVNAMIKLPCQIVRGGRRVILRVLHWNPYLPSFFRLANVLRC